MTKKVVVSKTFLFIFILSFIVIFKTVFGEENTLIGVTVITATLMFLERDLTSTLLSNFFKILSINLILGSLAFFASQNILIGLICNFLALFMVGYFFNYELRKPMYVPFGLQYLFMVSTPINLEQLPMRFMSLVFGAAFVILVQLILNKNKLQKLGEKNILLICDELKYKIKFLKENKNTNTCDKKIEELSKELKRIIYDNRKEEFYVTEKGINLLNILFSLERISLILDRYNLNDLGLVENTLDNLIENKNKILDTINNELNDIKSLIKNDTDLNLVQKLEDIKGKKDLDDSYLYEIYNLEENIYENIKQYKVNKIKTDTNKKIEIPQSFKSISIHKRNFNTESLRFSYALKIGLLTAIAGFIMDYFKLQDGRWIMFTVFSLTQTYSENCLTKSEQRVEATLIGSALFFVLFTIIKDESIRGLILILAGYMNSYLTNYKYLIICVTVSSLGSAAIASSPDILVLHRVMYIIIGAIISLLANRYILPYDAKKGHKDLINIYKNTTKEIVKEIAYYVKDKNNHHSIKNLLLIPTLIEDRLLLVNTMFNDRKEEEFIKTQKRLISDMYNFYISVKKGKIEDGNLINMLGNIDDVSNFTVEEYEDFRDNIINQMKNINCTNDKIVCENLICILDETIKIDSKQELQFV
ncbi:FUSC family protein [Faecalimicrobium sp. JNUCC 81]